MASLIYEGALDFLGPDWTSADLRWIALDGIGYTLSLNDQFISDLDPGANEVAVAGYDRVTATGMSRNPGFFTVVITYGIDNPDFGLLDTGAEVTALVLAAHVTDDSDSPLIAYLSMTPTNTNGGEFTPTIPGGQLFSIQQTL